MARRFATGFLAMLIGCAPFGAVPAGAATQIGSECDPDSAPSGALSIQLSRLTPPVVLKTTSPGVVTSWRVQSAGFLEPRTSVLKVVREIGGEYEVVAESEPGLVLEKPNQFQTRIPVAAGVSFGVTSSKTNPACIAPAGNSIGIFAGDASVGSKAKLIETRAERLLSLAVFVEPDVDGDGYGDETQDQCPQSAATQGACPVPPGGGTGSASVKLKGKPRLEGNVVAVKLTTSAATKVTVTGSIRGKRAAKPASKMVSPGETGRVYLQLKKSVKQRLANLPRKRKLRMVVEVKAAGAPTVSAEIALPGRKSPAVHR